MTPVKPALEFAQEALGCVAVSLGAVSICGNPGSLTAPPPTMTDPTTALAALLDIWHDSVQTMATACQDSESAAIKHCYVCDRTDGLTCVAPGWGGVWACRACREEPE